MIIESFDATKVYINGVLYPKMFVSKIYYGELIEIVSIFTKKRFGKIEKFSEILVDGVKYDNTIATINALNGILFAFLDTGFADYYQWLFPGKTTNIVGSTVVNAGTAGVDADVQSFNQVATFDGTAYLQSDYDLDLWGITITTFTGTSTPTINGFNIELTAGTFEHMLLSNGDEYYAQAGNGVTLYSNGKVHNLFTRVDGDGTITPASGTYDDGDIVTITATPTNPEVTELDRIAITDTDETIQIYTDTYNVSMNKEKSAISYFKNILIYPDLVSIYGADLLAFAPINETSGNTLTEMVSGANGTYYGVALNNEGYRGKSGYWDGSASADVSNIADKINMDEGSLMFILKMDKEEWDRETTVDLLYFRNAGGDYFLIQKAYNGNGLTFILARSYSNKNIIVNAISNVIDYHICMTWSKNEDYYNVYINSVPYYEFGGLSSIGTLNGGAFNPALCGLGNGRSSSLENPCVAYISNFAIINKATNETELHELLKLDQLIFDGDSRLAGKGWNVGAVGNNHFASRNAGYSGFTIQQCIDHAPTVVDTKIRSERINTSIIFAGVNSIGLTAQQLFDQLKEYCLARKSAGFQYVGICTEIDAQDAARLADGWSTKYLELNILIKNNYTDFADFYIDFGAIPEMQDASNPIYFTTKLHPTIAGYKLLSEKAAETINLIF